MTGGVISGSIFNVIHRLGEYSRKSERVFHLRMPLNALRPKITVEHGDDANNRIETRAWIGKLSLRIRVRLCF
jgi:hypothetical protein